MCQKDNENVALKVIRKNCCFKRFRLSKSSKRLKIPKFVCLSKIKNPVDWLLGVKGELRLKKISFTYDYSPNYLC